MLSTLSDRALLLTLGDSLSEAVHQRVQAVLAAFEEKPVPGITEIVPAYASLTLHYDPWLLLQTGLPADEVEAWLQQQILDRLANAPAELPASHARHIEVPVCYEGDCAPDLAAVAEHCGLTPEQVIQRHMARQYLVHLVGFAPGFAYLGGMDAALAMPRLATPRARVPAGSVGIAGEQTGIYPLATPGGWQLIGRTPLRLFTPETEPPVLLRAGDRVSFRRLSRAEFETLSTAP